MSDTHDVERLNRLKRSFEEQGGDFVALWNSVGTPDDTPEEASDAILGKEEMEKLEEELRERVKKRE